MTESKIDDRRPDGFLERGGNVTRLEAFVDAAFAFAVTLLVISLDGIPENRLELVLALKAIPSFAASFALVAMFWFAHNTWSRRYGLDDMGSILLSLVFVGLVLVWVYPLRALFSVAFAWVSLLLPKGWQVPANFTIAGIDDLRFMFFIYALAWSSLGLVVALLYRQGWKYRDTLGLDRNERLATRAEIARWMWVPATGVLSIVVAILLPANAPDWLAGAPGMAYIAMAFSDKVMESSRRRWKVRVDAETASRD